MFVNDVLNDQQRLSVVVFPWFIWIIWKRSKKPDFITVLLDCYMRRKDTLLVTGTVIVNESKTYPDMSHTLRQTQTD
jgi:hypothetical protein